MSDPGMTDDELMLIFTSRLGIVSLKQLRGLRGYIVNLRRQIYLLKRQFPEYQGQNKQ